MSLRQVLKLKKTHFHDQIELLKPITTDYLEKEKVFTTNLFEANNIQCKDLIFGANESQIITILLLLFFISHRKIPLTASVKEKIKKRKKVKKLKKLFPNVKDLYSTIYGTRLVQMQKIKPFLLELPEFLTAVKKLPNTNK